MRPIKFNNLLTVLTLGLLIGFTACNNDSEVVDQLDVAEPAVQDNVIPGQYIVTFKGDFMTPVSGMRTGEFSSRDEQIEFFQSNGRVLTEKANAFFREVGIDAKNVSNIYTNAIAGFAATLSDEEVEQLKSDDRVAMIEADVMLSLNEGKIDVASKNKQPIARTQAQFVDCGMSLANGPRNGASINRKIFILDSGIDLDHEDLNVDVGLSAYGYGSSPDDDNGHGTHCAGIAAAIDNSYGVVGVSAGASLVAVKVMNSGGTGSASIITAGVDYTRGVASSGDVANMSLGVRGTISSLNNAVVNLANSGVRVAIASGNNGRPANQYSPGKQNGNRIYTVASIHCSLAWSSFSNYGNPPVDFVAHGQQVGSTYPNNGYVYNQGTSMAAPFVAGIMHYRNAGPRSCGTVTNRGYTYPIACI